MKVLMRIIFIWPFVIYTGEMSFNRVVNPFTVLDMDNQPYELPFCGGLNSPIQQFIDIDGDQDLDLFIQDSRQNRLIFFLNIGTSEEFIADWQTDNYQHLDTGSWFKFVDADGDNDYDIFAEGAPGMIRFYLNQGTTKTPEFISFADTLRDNLGDPIHIGGFSIPEWADLNNDRRPDLFFGNIQDGSITFYQHSGEYINGVPLFVFKTNSFHDLQIITGGAESSEFSSYAFENKRHGANSLNFTDIDNDGDKDLFWGDFFWSSLIFIPNHGSADSAIFHMEDLVNYYPQGDPLITGGFNVPCFADIDNDGDQDMFVGILGGYLSLINDIRENFYFYRNSGTSSQSHFTLETRQFLNMPDIGHNSVPALVDIDNDNDPDLFVANEIDLDAPQHASGRVWFFENTGSIKNPLFKLQNKHYLGKDGRTFFDANLSPAFVDIDNDGDQDLFLGNWEGKILFYVNNGSAGQAEFVFQDENYAAIDVGSNSAPAFADIDGDGDYDLFVGENSQNPGFGRINYYENIGRRETAMFEEVTANYSNIDLGNDQFLRPFFADIDNDYDLDLFIGTKDQGIVFYRNSGDKETALFNSDSSQQLASGIFRSTPVVFDIDADGNPDILSGARGGGLLFFKNQTPLTLADKSPNAEISFKLDSNFPNPFNNSTMISYQLSKKADVELSIYNLLGQKVATLVDKNQLAGNYHVQWDATGFASGIYFYTIQTNNGFRQSRKLLLLK
jgi:Secretion system C-terminal sorting domain/FG-GAP-like repeat